MLKFILIWASVSSVLAFAFYGIDKMLAKAHGRRIPEAVLLTLSLLGGGVGGLFAMLLFRHKTKRAYFYAANIFGVIIIAVLAVLL